MKHLIFVLLLFHLQNTFAQNEPFQWNLLLSSFTNNCRTTPDNKFLVLLGRNNHIKFWDIEKRVLSHDIGRFNGNFFIFEAENKNKYSHNTNTPILITKECEKILKAHWNEIKKLSITDFSEKYFIVSQNEDFTLSILHVASGTFFHKKEKSQINNQKFYERKSHYFFSKDKKKMLRMNSEDKSVELTDVQSDTTLLTYKEDQVYMANDIYLDNKNQAYFSIEDTVKSSIGIIDLVENKIEKLILPADTLVKELKQISIVGIANEHPWLLLTYKNNLLLFDVLKNQYSLISDAWAYESYVCFSDNDEYLIEVTDEIKYLKTSNFTLEKSYKIYNTGTIFPKVKRQIKGTGIYSVFYPVSELYYIWDTETNKKIFDIPHYFSAEINTVSENEKFVVTAFAEVESSDRQERTYDYLLWDLEKLKFPFSFSQRRFLTPTDTAVTYCKVGIERVQCCDNYRRYYDTTGCYNIIKQEKLGKSVYSEAIFSDDEYKNQYLMLVKNDNTIEIWDLINMKLVLEKKLLFSENSSFQENRIVGFSYKKGILKLFDYSRSFSFVKNEYETDIENYSLGNWNEKYYLSPNGVCATFYTPYTGQLFLKIQKYDEDKNLKTNYFKINKALENLSFTEDEKYLIGTDNFSQIVVFDLEKMNFEATLLPFSFGDKNYNDYLTPDKKWKIRKWYSTYEILKNN